MTDLINETRYGRHRIIDLHLYSEYQEEIDENLEDWQVTNMTATRIDIQLNYKDPIQVSTGWDRDELIIDINLTEYSNL